MSEDFGCSLVALTIAPQAGAYVLVRVANPLFPHATTQALPIVGRVAIVAVVYGALECTNPNGIAGGLTLWISIGLALAGTAIAIGAVESRVGAQSLARFGGLDAKAPVLAGTFLVLGLACVGLPGTLGFVAEDLLVHGVLESYPGVGMAIIAATAANGFTVVRCFMRTFFGPCAPKKAVADLLGGERIALAGLATMVVLLGVVPQLTIGTRAAIADRLAAINEQAAIRSHR
jgi:NADH-quinone oxidoreductase subunit M